MKLDATADSREGRRLRSGWSGGHRWGMPVVVLVVALALAGVAPAHAYEWRVVQQDGMPASLDLETSVGWPDVPLACDGNGDGRDAPAGFVAGRFRFGDVVAPVAFGNERDTKAVCGDWDGDGFDTPAVVRSGVWYVRNRRGSGAADLSFRFGSATSRTQFPAAGDWDGDGRDGIAMVDGRTWYLRQTASGGYAQSAVRGTEEWCAAGEQYCNLTPGDWNGDGRDEPGQVDRWGRLSTTVGGGTDSLGGEIFVAGRFSGGPTADVVRIRGAQPGDGARWERVWGPGTGTPVPRGAYGADPLFCDNDGDGVVEPAAVKDGVFEFGDGPRVWLPWAAGVGEPLCGDWDGNGTQTPGFHDRSAGVFRLTNLRANSPVQVTFGFGGRGRVGVSGDWNGDGRDGVGVVEGTHWWMRDTLTSGGAQRRATTAEGLPLVGWDARAHRSLPGVYHVTTWYLQYPEYPETYLDWNIVGGPRGGREVMPLGPSRVLMDRRGAVWGINLIRY